MEILIKLVNYLTNEVQTIPPSVFCGVFLCVARIRREKRDAVEFFKKKVWWNNIFISLLIKNWKSLIVINGAATEHANNIRIYILFTFILNSLGFIHPRLRWMAVIGETEREAKLRFKGARR